MTVGTLRCPCVPKLTWYRSSTDTICFKICCWKFTIPISTIYLRRSKILCQLFSSDHRDKDHKEARDRGKENKEYRENDNDKEYRSDRSSDRDTTDRENRTSREKKTSKDKAEGKEHREKDRPSDRYKRYSIKWLPAKSYFFLFAKINHLQNCPRSNAETSRVETLAGMVKLRFCMDNISRMPQIFEKWS